VLARFAEGGVPAWEIGTTTASPRLRIERDGALVLDLDLDRLAGAHRGALPTLLA
jgi:hypothetical protein